MDCSDCPTKHRCTKIEFKYSDHIHLISSRLAMYRESLGIEKGVDYKKSFQPWCQELLETAVIVLLQAYETDRIDEPL